MADAGATNAIPEFMRQVIAPVAPLSDAEIANRNALVLNSMKDVIYANALDVYVTNMLDSVPIILGLFSSQGGEFTLYRPGEPALAAPRVPVGYEVSKAVGHSSMAVYQLVARYTGNPADPAWRAPMAIYREQHDIAMESIDAASLSPDALAAVRTILQRNMAFMDECLSSGTFTPETLTVFAQSQKPSIEVAVGYAAQQQVGHWMSVLDEWKQMLGDSWARTYGATNSLYVTRTNNILFTVMAQFFGKEAINDRLIMLETTEFTTTQEAMLTLLVRIVADRALGQVFFKDYFLMDVELLSTGARDALAKELEQRLGVSGGAAPDYSGFQEIAAQAKARGLEPMMPPLAPFHTQEWPWRTSAASGHGPRALAEVE